MRTAHSSQANALVVLCGGDSEEREVSLRSGVAVATALRTNGYDVTVLDPANPGPDYEKLLLESDVVFPALHGKGGEDGQVQKWLEDHHVRFVGSSSAASALCFDKWRYKETLDNAGLPTPRGQLVDKDSWQAADLASGPFVLKPYNGGSSIDTFIVRGNETLDIDLIQAAFERHPQMLLEELIEGREITMGILCEESLPVIEIVPPEGDEFTYDNKYNGTTQEICPPRTIPENVQQEAQAMALKIHKLLHVSDMSRTDMIMRPDGSLSVLETNTIPGMTDQSLLPKAAAAAGYDMPEFTRKLVEAALARQP